MKLTNAQRKIIREAMVASLKSYFTGAGAISRWMKFIYRVALASAAMTLILLAMESWAMVSGLLAGPNHEEFFREAYAWLVAMPVEQAIAETHALFIWRLLECLQNGAILGFSWTLLQLIKPAADEAKQQVLSASV